MLAGKTRWACLPAVLLAGAALGGLSGCNRDPYGLGKTVPVVGRVTLNGQPLTLGHVRFVADDKKGTTCRFEPGGEIDADGNFKMYTHKQEGVPPGWYKVAITSVEPIDPHDVYAARKWFINQKYASEQTSELELEVVENPQPGAYDIDLKEGPAAPEGTPPFPTAP